MARYLSQKKLLLTGCVLYVVNWVYFTFSGPLLPWYLCQFGFGVFYIILGYVYRRYEDRIDKIIYRHTFLILTASILYIVSIYFLDENYSIMGSKYLIDCFLITCLGLYIFIYLNKKVLYKIPAFLFVGANTLLYFGLHGKGLTASTYAAGKFFDLSLAMFPELFHIIMTVLVAILTAIPVIIINRYVPQVTGKDYKLKLFINKNNYEKV